MTLGKYLKQLRNGSGLTLRELFVKTGLSTPYLSQLETERIKKPSADVLLKLSLVYNVTVDSLLSAAKLDKSDYLTPHPDIQAKGTLISDFFSHEDVHKMYMDEMQRSRELSKEITAVRSWLFSSFGDYGTIDQILAGKGHIETDTAVKAVIFYILNKPA